MQKPVLSSQRPAKKGDEGDAKLRKLEIFFRYRLPSIYRELRKPIYEDLKTKAPANRNASMQKKPSSEREITDKNIETLYKRVMLNSKYHHREKMRFSRMPLLKFIKYDFQALNEKLKSKAYCRIYDDLEEEDEEDEGKEKKEYEVDSQFSEEAISKYKRKHNITGKIIISQGYDDLKERLVSEHGWTENPDTSSLIYDYKHMSKKKDIDYVNLLEGQGVNHFNENKSVTAKFGLTRNIRNLGALGKDLHEFFPRCYDVNDVAELENFYQSFMETYAESLLKDYIVRKGNVPITLAAISQKAIQKCMEISRKRFLSTLQKTERIEKNNNLLVNADDYEFLRNYEKQLLSRGSEGCSSEGCSSEECSCDEKLLEEVCALDEQASREDPQWRLNRDNIWIVKPASLSRGRGIKTFDNLNEILDYIIGKEISWVVQKYIENPLIIKKRKFDIRQWVLLTDLKPFRVWTYAECYVRFCATEYTPENLKDRKVHLTNNSVTKGISDITNDGIEENMLSQAAFVKLLREMEGRDIFYEKIKPQMNRIATETLESVKENIVSRKNTMEIFGFDFMIDEEYRVWLIEVNSSPTMEHSTKVTAEIVSRGMADYADVVNNYLFGGKQYRPNNPRSRYGGWDLLT